MTAFARLGDVAEVNPRFAQRPALDESISFLGMAGVDAETGTTTKGETRAFSEVAKGYTLFRDRDILLAKITPCFENGKIAQAALSHDIGVGSTEFHVIRPDPARLDVRFALHLLRGREIRRAGEKRMTGSAGQRRVPEAFIAEISVPIPPIEEQRRIAAILDDADDLRSKRRQAVAHLETLTQAIFLDMFGPTSRGWPMTNVGSLVDPARGGMRTGPFGSQLLTSEFTEQGVAVLGIDNAVQNKFVWSQRRFISAEKYEKLKRYTVNAGDVLITIMGTCGRAAVVPPGIPLAINTKHLCCITLDQMRCTPQYLHAYFLRHPVAREYLGRTAKGAIMSGLNMGIIKDLPVILPPLGRQEEFGERLGALDKTLVENRSGLDALDALFASLQQRAFSGQL